MADIMVCAPTYHSGDFVTIARRTYHREKTTAETRNACLRDLAKGDENNMINYLDMMHAFYNCVIDEPAIHDWCARNRMKSPVFLYRDEPNLCGYNVLFEPPAG